MTTQASLPGKVWLVGAGPGAADLLTLRAARLLAQADIVLHDALVHPDVLALAPQAIQVPVGKRCGRLSTTQRFINKRLVDAAQRHRRVVRLKGGDPMLFGRAQEEIDALRDAGIEVEVVPGISAVFGASADALQSLTQRGVSRSVILLTPRFGEGESRHDWARPAAAADTIVLYMAGRSAEPIREGLLAAGLPPGLPAIVVENASLPGERIQAGRLGDLPAMTCALGDGPALLMLGAVYEALADRRDRRASGEAAAA
ncbi:MAG: uroporphyrinogen-III C-methyltransferase [Burkholderiaceae bacterium]